MLNGEHEILIEKFFRGELTADELQVFKYLLQNDMAFRAEVELQRTVVSGIGAYSKGLLRAELGEIHNEVKAGLKDYQPPGNGGGWAGKAFKFLLLATAVGAGVYFYINREQFKPYTDKIWKSVVKMDTVVVGVQESNEVSKHGKVDTVWHVIHTTKVRKGDTVAITSREELYDKLESGEGRATVKKDTQYLIQEKKVNLHH